MASRVSGITNNKRNVSLSARDSKVSRFEMSGSMSRRQYDEVFPSRRFILCIVVVVSVKYFLFVMSDEGSQPAAAAAAAAASSDHQQVPAEVPDYVGKSTHVTSHSEPIPCSDPKICQFFTHHQENTAPGTYFNYQSNDHGPAPPIPVLGVTAMSPDWVGRLIDSIDHPVERLVVVQNGESNSTHAVIEQALARYKQRSHHGARVTYLYWKTNEGCAAGAPYSI
jgi:hypothetical protein